MSTLPGRRAEARAAWWYRLRGYRVLERNAWVGGYELDLVLRRGRRVIFCEVKQKTGSAFGEAEAMVNAEKRRRVRRAAAGWLAAHPAAPRSDVSFDVIAVQSGRLRRLPQAF